MSKIGQYVIECMEAEVAEKGFIEQETGQLS